MPLTKSFVFKVADAKARNKNLSDAQLPVWLKVANGVFKRQVKLGKSLESAETTAIKVANGYVKNVKQSLAHECAECGYKGARVVSEAVCPNGCGEMEPDCGEDLQPDDQGEDMGGDNESCELCADSDDNESLIDEIIAEAAERNLCDGDRAATEQLFAKGVAGTSREELKILLARILEAAKFKAVSGARLPKAAFAYVGDPDVVGTWKLPIRTAGGALDKRLVAAATAAFSPGGFRGQKVRIPREGVAKVKAKIRAARRSLELPESPWVKEADVERRYKCAKIQPLTEAFSYDADSGEGRMRIITAGPNLSGKRFWPPEVLERDGPTIFTDVPIGTDHPTKAEEKERPEGSVLHEVGRTRMPEWNPEAKNEKGETVGALDTDFVIFDPVFKSRLKNMKNAGIIESMRNSVRTLAACVNTTIGGKKTSLVESLIKSPLKTGVDFVTKDGARGFVLAFESAAPEEDIDTVSAEELRERRPDIVKIIESAAAERTKQEYVKKDKAMAEETAKIEELEEVRETLTDENTALKAKVEAHETEKAKAEAQSAIAALIAEAELPDPTKARLTVRFEKAGSVDGVAEAIKDRKAEIAELTEAGIIKGLGPNETPDAAKVAREALKANQKRRYLAEGFGDGVAEERAESFVAGR